VKTRLRADDIAEFGDRAPKIAVLESKRPLADGSTAPIQCLFAYSAWSKPATVVDHVVGLDDAARPDLVCVIDQGLIAGKPEYLKLEHKVDGFSAGITLVNG
jgi:hypothetical protein